jgi:hypothetical protein
MNSGNLSTAKSEREVNAFAGVRSLPRSENMPKARIVTQTGMLFSKKLFTCGKKLARVIILILH